MAVMIKRVERPRELKWYHAGAKLYGDWGTSKAYVLGIAGAFLHPWMGCLFYVAVAAMWLVPDRRIESRLSGI